MNLDFLNMFRRMSGSRDLSLGKTNTLDVQRRMMLEGKPINQPAFRQEIAPSAQPRQNILSRLLKIFS